MRQIFLLILLFIVGQWVAKALRRHHADSSARTGANPGGAQRTRGSAGANRGARQPMPASAQLAEPMIRCAECGVHAPKSDSVTMAGQPFCCAAHAHRHAARPTGRDAR